MFSEDLSAFFDATEFGTACALQTVPPVPFTGILSEVDEEMLQGYVVGTVREIRWPTAAATLLEGQLITAGAATWRVLRDGRKVNDGAESLTYLVEA